MLSVFKTLTVCALLSILAVAPAAAREISAAKQVKTMARGVNVLGYDPLWTDPAKARFQINRHFRTIKAGGFSTVRINLQAFAHMDAGHQLDPAWLKILDQVVAAALAQKLTVILDEHDFAACGEDPATCKPKLLAFWAQVGAHYKTAPDGVVFELLNEPNKGLTDAVWNAWVAELLPAIRAANPTRNIVVGPTNWNNLERLKTLELPQADRHLIVTFHYYTPFEFTHQGAAWSPSTPTTGVRWGSDAERARIKTEFDGVQAWAKTHDRPILLGEFGAYDKGPMDSRVAYTAAVAREAEAHGFAWAYWQFDSDFIAYDVKQDAWVEPIHGALVPKK
jgi:endoglucanase